MPVRFVAALCLTAILSSVTFAADKRPAADNSAQVQAKIVYGAAAEQQQRADIDLWISEAVAKKIVLFWPNRRPAGSSLRVRASDSTRATASTSTARYLTNPR